MRGPARSPYGDDAVELIDEIAVKGGLGIAVKGVMIGMVVGVVVVGVVVEGRMRGW